MVRLGLRTVDKDDCGEYKSKNLHAERRRRQKLGDSLLALRSLVPIITNVKFYEILHFPLSLTCLANCGFLFFFSWLVLDEQGSHNCGRNYLHQGAAAECEASK